MDRTGSKLPGLSAAHGLTAGKGFTLLPANVPGSIEPMGFDMR